MKKLTLIFTALALLLVTNLHAEEPLEPKGEHIETVEFSDDADQEIIGKAVVKAALGRKWNIDEKEDGILKISLNHRGYESTLYLVYDDHKVDIYSDSWTINKKGERKKEKHPDGWIKNLAKDIRVFADREIYMP